MHQGWQWAFKQTRGQAVTATAATNSCEVCVQSIVSRAVNIPSFSIICNGWNSDETVSVSSCDNCT